MKRSSRIILILLPFVFVGGSIFGYWAKSATVQNSSFRGYVSDMDRLLPAFFGTDIEEGLSGTIKLKVAYDKEKVSSVTVLSTDLHTQTDYANRFPGLVELSRDRIIRTVKGWTTYFVSPFESELTITLRIDKSLPPRAREYRIEAGEYGEITDLVMTGPELSPKQGRGLR